MLLDDYNVCQKEQPVPLTNSSQCDMNEKLQQTFLEIYIGMDDKGWTSIALDPSLT